MILSFEEKYLKQLNKDYLEEELTDADIQEMYIASLIEYTR